jgi:hypothetical protein
MVNIRSFVGNYNKIIGEEALLANPRLKTSEWRAMQNEYESAKASLSSLSTNSGILGESAKLTLAQLEESYSTVKRRLMYSVDFRHSLTAPIPPPIDRTKCKGILAYRVWDSQIKGTLCPVVMTSRMAWGSEVVFSDHIPSADNTYGLHATRIEQWLTNGYDDFISGIVDLYGKVVEHADGVMRAECARIKLIMLNISNENQNTLLLTGMYESIKLTYPNTPVIVVTDYIKKLILWREVLINYSMLNKGGFYNGY